MILHRFFQKTSSNTPIDHGEHQGSRNRKNDFDPPMKRKRHHMLQRDIVTIFDLDVNVVASQNFKGPQISDLGTPTTAPGPETGGNTHAFFEGGRAWDAKTQNQIFAHSPHFGAITSTININGKNRQTNRQTERQKRGKKKTQNKTKK